MARKKLRLGISYSSIFNDAKWINSIEIRGFNSRRAKDNYKFIIAMLRLVKKYNNI